MTWHELTRGIVMPAADGSNLWSGVPKFAAASLVSASAGLMVYVMSIADEGRFSVARFIAAFPWCQCFWWSA